MGEPSHGSQGLLSGVFSYVSREVGSFVTNATGGVITVVRFIINCSLKISQFSTKFAEYWTSTSPTKTEETRQEG